MIGFIHKRAVKSYKQEIENFTAELSKLPPEQLADIFIMSVWTRAGMQNEGVFKYPDGQKYSLPYLSGYPILESTFSKIVKSFRNQGLQTEAAAITIWVHTCRGLFNYNEMKNELDVLWKLLMNTKDFWSKYLDKYYNEDKARLDPALLEETRNLSKEMIKYLPPKPASGSDE